MARPFCNAILISIATLMSVVDAGDQPATGSIKDVAELKFLAGSWQGHLEYLDYGDGKTRVRLPTVIRYQVNKESISYETSFTEPNGSEVKDQGKIRTIGTGDQLFFGGRSHRIVSKQLDPESQSYRIVLSNTGKDNQRRATFETTIRRDASTLRITKRVKYDGQDSTFTRNEYVLRKTK